MVVTLYIAVIELASQVLAFAMLFSYTVVIVTVNFVRNCVTLITNT